MINHEETSQSLQSLSQKSFDEARATANTAKNSATLWAAALTIVWLSGLEPMWQSVAASNRVMMEINTGRQEATRWAIIQHHKISMEERELEQLERFETEYPLGEKRKKEGARLEQNLKLAEKKFEELKESPDRRISQDARSARDKAYQAHWIFKNNAEKLARTSLDVRRRQVATYKDDLAKEASTLKNIYAEAKSHAQAQERNVHFDLFGLEFKAPPLLAPLLWCIFSTALLGYLVRARAKSIASCIQGFRLLGNLPRLSSDQLASLTSQLPSLAALPAYQHTYTTAIKKGRTDWQQEWTHLVFPPLLARQYLIILLFLIPVFLFVIELRVVWIALELSRNLGENWARGLLPLALLITLATTGWLGACWLSSSWVGEVDEQSKKRSDPVGWDVVLLFLALVTSAIIWRPQIGIAAGHFLQSSLSWIGAICVTSTIVAIFFQLRRTKNTDADFSPMSGAHYLRRRLMIASVSVVALTTVIVSLPVAQRVVQQIKNRKKPATSHLRPGFYRRVSQDSKQTTKNGTVIFHFVGPEGRVSRRGSFPLVYRLKGSDPPSYFQKTIENGFELDQPIEFSTIASNPSEMIKVRETDSQASKTKENEPEQFLAVVSNHSTNSIKDPERKEEANIEIKTEARETFERFRVHTQLPLRRVNLATASWGFEEAALDVLEKGSMDGKDVRKVSSSTTRIYRAKGKRSVSRKDAERVCKLLLCAIQHDLLYKHRIQKDRKKEKPSFRLYDLLAGVAVRYDQPGYFQQMHRIINKSGLDIVFQPRIEKWKDISGSWRRKWRNQKSQITWTSASRAVVF